MKPPKGWRWVAEDKAESILTNDIHWPPRKVSGCDVGYLAAHRRYIRRIAPKKHKPKRKGSE